MFSLLPSVCCRIILSLKLRTNRATSLADPVPHRHLLPTYSLHLCPFSNFLDLSAHFLFRWQAFPPLCFSYDPSALVNQVSARLSQSAFVPLFRCCFTPYLSRWTGSGSFLLRFLPFYSVAFFLTTTSLVFCFVKTFNPPHHFILFFSKHLRCSFLILRNLSSFVFPFVIILQCFLPISIIEFIW